MAVPRPALSTVRQATTPISVRTGSHCLSDNGENLLAVDPTDKGITLNRSSMTDFVKSVAPGADINIDLATDSDIDGLFI